MAIPEYSGRPDDVDSWEDARRPPAGPDQDGRFLTRRERRQAEAARQGAAPGPFDPTGPFDPGRAAKPGRSADPAGPFNPAGAFSPAGPFKPAGSFSPGDPFNPAGPFRPAGPVNPPDPFSSPGSFNPRASFDPPAFFDPPPPVQIAPPLPRPQRPAQRPGTGPAFTAPVPRVGPSTWAPGPTALPALAPDPYAARPFGFDSAPAHVEATATAMHDPVPSVLDAQGDAMFARLRPVPDVGVTASGGRSDNRGTRDGASSTMNSGGKPPPSLSRRLLRDAREVLGTVVVALGIAIVIKTFLVQPFKIPSQSMEDTLLVGDRVLVSKLEPGPLSLQRGDVVVFLDPGGWLDAAPQDQSVVNQALTFVGLLPANSGEHLIKRVIGLPGDTVTCCDAEGRLLVNNQPLDETYIYPGDQPSAEDFTVTVPAGRIWVMGDHRSVSRDSRFHGDSTGDLAAGSVPLDNVVGRAVLVSWPLSRWDWLGRPDGVFDGVAGLDGVK